MLTWWLSLILQQTIVFPMYLTVDVSGSDIVYIIVSKFLFYCALKLRKRYVTLAELNSIFMTKNQEQYTIKVISQLAEMFNSDSENFIDKNDFLDDGNATDFFYALACSASHFYTTLTGENIDLLGYNHIENRLIFQNSQVAKDDE